MTQYLVKSQLRDKEALSVIKEWVLDSHILWKVIPKAM
jgi:hypothetical protein